MELALWPSRVGRGVVLKRYNKHHIWWGESIRKYEGETMLECHMTEDLPNSVSTQLALSQPAHVDLLLSFTVARRLRLGRACCPKGFCFP